MECNGMCLNGGICANGVCQCQESFEGSNCQNIKEVIVLEKSVPWTTGIEVSWSLIFFYAGTIVLIVVLFGISFWAFRQTKIAIEKAEKERAKEEVEERHKDGITAPNSGAPIGKSDYK